MLFRSLVVAAFALIACAPARPAAQTVRPERPFRGLFGGNGSEERGRSLALDWGILGGYDDNLIADTGTASPPNTVVNGTYSSANSGLTYTVRGEHRSFVASGQTSGRYYPDVAGLSAVDGGAGATFSSDFGARTRLDLSQSFAYQPYFGLNLFAVGAPSVATSVQTAGPGNAGALNSRSSYALDGRAALSRMFGRRSTLRADYNYRNVRFGGGQTFDWRLATLSFSRNVTRYAALRVGYGYGVGENTVAVAAPSIVNHNFDFGLDYDRQLSFSRRTRLNFSSGSTGVVDRGITKYRIIGTAGITREVGRTWQASASYNRGVQYLPGFGESLFAGTAQVRYGGLLHRRIEASVAAAHSSGQLGFQRDGASYSSATASADMRIAMSRTLSLFGQYMYYRYGFDVDTRVPFDLPPQLDRHSVRFGLSGWLPILR